MKLLALDTATEACTVGLAVDGEVRELFETAPRAHGRLLLPMIDRLLAEAGLRLGALDAIAFGRGPGAFTGVRIGVAAAQGLALGADVPLIPVSTLATLARGAAAPDRPVLAAIDARMGEIYAAAYAADAAGAELVERLEERVCRPEALKPPSGDAWFGVGSGWKTYVRELRQSLDGRLSGWDGDALPHARDMFDPAAVAWTRGEAVDPAEAQPVYLRQQVIQAPQFESGG